MVGSIDPRCETARGTHWPKKVAWLFGARVAETILASGPKSPHQQAGHMDASDPIKPSKKLLWHGGRPHMGPDRTGHRDCRVACRSTALRIGGGPQPRAGNLRELESRIVVEWADEARALMQQTLTARSACSLLSPSWPGQARA